jgi:caa(3)-type oxidase subunit IV
MKNDNPIIPSEFTLFTYFICYICLLILLGLSLILVNVHLGKWVFSFALTIATLKALIVLSFFMHARKSRNYALVIGALLLFLLGVVLLGLSDFKMRIGSI